MHNLSMKWYFLNTYIFKEPEANVLHWPNMLELYFYVNIFFKIQVQIIYF